MITTPLPLEVSDPELHQLFIDVTHGDLPAKVIDTRVFKTFGKLQGKEITLEIPKRNEPCICGSGKKFKKCCMSLT